MVWVRGEIKLVTFSRYGIKPYLLIRQGRKEKELVCLDLRTYTLQKEDTICKPIQVILTCGKNLMAGSGS